MIVCGPAADLHYETSPTLIIEVASPSTINVDRREKAISYAGIERLEQYIIIEPVIRAHRSRLRHCRRLGVATAGPGHVLFAHHCPIVVDDFYDRLDADAALGQ